MSLDTAAPPASGSPTPRGFNQTRPPLYRNVTVVKWFAQLATLAVVIFALWFLTNEAGTNLAAKDISTSFDFLETDPGFVLSEGIDTDPDTGGRALWVGMVNTFRLAGVGILFATILGVFVGLARLSGNWIVNKIGTVFVEIMRNVPLLVFIIVMDAVIGSINRGVDEQWPIANFLHVSSKGFSLPRVFISDGFYQWLVVMLLAAVAARFVFRRRQLYQDTTGQPGYAWLSALGVLTVAAIVGWFINPIFGFLGGPLQAISDAIAKIPEGAVQLVLAVLALLLAANWVRSFLNQRRTPAGLTQLTDDDKYSVVFAGIMGLAIAFVFLVLWPGLSSWLINSTGDLFQVLADKFGGERGSSPFGAKRPGITEGRFANYDSSGFNMSKGFAIVFISVWLNTSAFVGEIVRGGILAVSKGQSEAAAALGLRRSQALRQVILPQAFRVVLPPLGNQYLNLTKNTSLAFAVGFSDMFNVSQVLTNQTGRVIPILVITMLFYLACSLTISTIVNFFNVRLKIVER